MAMEATATRSYLIPGSDLSLDERRAIRGDTDKRLMDAALKVGIRADVRELIIRDTSPNVDLGLAAQDDWLIAGAGVVGVELQYINAVIAQDRVVGFYGAAAELAAIPSLSRLRFTVGAASATTWAQYALEQLYTRLEQFGYFGEPVLYTRTQTARIMVMPRIAFIVNSERLTLFARTIEPLGERISAPSI